MKKLPWRDRIPKLPKWAQNYIGKLEGDIIALKKERERVGAGKTAIYWSMFPDDGDHYLPDRATIVVHTNHGELNISLRDGRLRVCVAPGRLTVRPESANVITVEVEGP